MRTSGRRSVWTRQHETMFSSGPSKSASYRPYAIQSMVGKTSMKALAAKAVAKIVSEKPKEPKSLLDSPPKLQPQSNDDVVLVGSEEEDALNEFSPARSSRSSSRRRVRQDVEFLDDCITSSAKRKAPHPKKKRLSKAEKATKAAKVAASAASQKARAALLAALENAKGEEIAPFPSDSTPAADSWRESSKEQVFVLWGNQKHKFTLFKNESMRSVFEKMAEKMRTDPHRVLIFCNSDPTHTVSPLDCLDDVGEERIFLSAPKDTPIGANLEGVAIPEIFQISLNVQVGGSKVRTKITMDKRDTLRAFMDKYCQMVGKSLADFVFSFDGDRLDPTERPDFYQLEGDELIDAKPV